jgi:hypothetical protein
MLLYCTRLGEEIIDERENIYGNNDGRSNDLSEGSFKIADEFDCLWLEELVPFANYNSCKLRPSLI